MKGSNIISFNEQTMVEILQHYFDSVLYARGQEPKVVSVKSADAGFFAVNIEEKPEVTE